MAWSDAEGPPSLTATHTWLPSGGGFGSTRLNDQVTWPPTLPFVRVQQITGWRSTPESEDNREARTYGEGEIVYPSRKLGRTFVYECRVEALTVQTLESAMSGVLNGFRDMDHEGLMQVEPYSGFGGGGAVWEYRARVTDLETEPVWDWSSGRRAQFWWTFALTLRLSDPYFYYLGTPYL